MAKFNKECVGIVHELRLEIVDEDTGNKLEYDIITGSDSLMIFTANDETCRRIPIWQQWLRINTLRAITYKWLHIDEPYLIDMISFNFIEPQYDTVGSLIYFE